MRASFITHRDGTVDLHLDGEAARGVFASVLFASRFHSELLPLAEVAKQGLRIEDLDFTEKRPLCQ